VTAGPPAGHLRGKDYILVINPNTDIISKIMERVNTAIKTLSVEAKIEAYQFA